MNVFLRKTNEWINCQKKWMKTLFNSFASQQRSESSLVWTPKIILNCNTFAQIYERERERENINRNGIENNQGILSLAKSLIKHNLHENIIISSYLTKFCVFYRLSLKWD